MYKSSYDIPKHPAVQLEIWDFSGKLYHSNDSLPLDQKRKCTISLSFITSDDYLHMTGKCNWQMSELPPGVDVILLCLDVCKPETHDSVINVVCMPCFCNVLVISFWCEAQTKAIYSKTSHAFRVE